MSPNSNPVPDNVKAEIDALPDDKAVYLAIREAKLPSGHVLTAMQCDYASTRMSFNRITSPSMYAKQHHSAPEDMCLKDDPELYHAYQELLKQEEQRLNS